MKKLVADSGSTKADWRLIENGKESRSFQTKGMNPFFRTSEDMFLELRETIFPGTGQDVEEVFFYGAGVADQQKGEIVRTALKQLFPDVKAETQSDVLGASRALFRNRQGIACILGTGSNACLYNGKEVTAKVPPLGFILGDECSGGVLGRQLIGDYFKEVMPEKLRYLFGEQFPVNLSTVLEHVYRMERPNRYLAGFAPFISQHIDEPYCRQLIQKNLTDFFERNVLKIPDYQNYSIGFVGSVAFYFSKFISNLVSKYGFKDYRILKEPINELVEYHKN